MTRTPKLWRGYHIEVDLFNHALFEYLLFVCEVVFIESELYTISSHFSLDVVFHVEECRHLGSWLQSLRPKPSIAYLTF